MGARPNTERSACGKYTIQKAAMTASAMTGAAIRRT